jgi:maleate isomerase
LSAFVKTLDPGKAEALVLLATDLPTFSAIAALEAQYGIPVLTSNQTLLWRALSHLGGSAPNLGRLFHD